MLRILFELFISLLFRVVQSVEWVTCINIFACAEAPTVEATIPNPSPSLRTITSRTKSAPATSENSSSSAASKMPRVSSRSRSQRTAPSAVFLNPERRVPVRHASPLSDRGTAFLGATSGFLPTQPLPPLPLSHAGWTACAAALPATCRNGSWELFISTLPTLPADSLPDEHLLRANACLGAIAHAICNVAMLDVPPAVMKPWRTIATRLGRPTPSFNSFDWFIYNFDLIPHRFVRTVDAGGDGDNVFETYGTDANAASSATLLAVAAADVLSAPECRITNPWQQTRPSVTVTGSMTEAHFITGCFAIEHAARDLPYLVATAQQAVLDSDDTALRDALIDIVRIIEGMTHGFRSADPRPLSATYVDPVEWGRCIGVVGLPVVPGEKTISGLLFPSIHLLDVFFSRRAYKSEMGVLERTDRIWLPPLHREFLKVVAKVSVFDYVVSRQSAQRDCIEGGNELLCVFRRALASFASEAGLLGKHRLRIAGFLELSMKVGRPATAAGTASTKWQQRMWRRVDMAMREGMRERQAMCSERVYKTIVRSCEPLDDRDGNVYRLVIDTKGALIYSPGDHIAILPENSQQLVDDTLDMLDLPASTMISVRNLTWLQALQNYGISLDSKSTDNLDNTSVVPAATCIEVRADTFLKLAALQPFDYQLGCSLIEALFVTNPAVANYLWYERATNVPIAIKMIRETSPISILHICERLDDVLRPMAARFYSVTSHMEVTPTSVELIVGAVRYMAQSKLSFKYGHIPWKEQSSTRSILMPGLAEEYLEAFVKSDGVEDDKYRPAMPRKKKSFPVDTLNNDDDMTTDDAEALKVGKNRFASLPLDGPVLKALDSLVVNLDQPSPRFTGKARYRAQVLSYDARHRDDSEPMLQGVSSSYVSRLRPGDAVRAYVVPELDFRIPTSGTAPIVLISLGTGMAPFRAFMKELIREKRAHGTVQRKAWLILGVRSRDAIPFRDDIEEAVCKERVVKLSMAFSREDIDLDVSPDAQHLVFRPGKRKYVQGLFENNPPLASDLWTMLSHGGHIFACGRPELEPLTRDLVVFAVKRFATTLWSSTFFDSNYNLARLADEYADRLAAERRLHIDAYYSGGPSPPVQRYTYADVAQHRAVADCWTIFRGGVYDITRYLPVHPGGPKVLLDKAGRDMSNDFNVAHGADNLRVAAMFAPYKIGDLEPFWKGSDRLKSFMCAWSAPLLHAALEHRSVFRLDVNQFEELREPASFMAFKSQVDSPGGLDGICAKFWAQYEPDLFSVLLSYASEDKLGAAMVPLSVAPGPLDCSTVQARLKLLRSGAANGLKAEFHRPDERVKRYAAFLEDIVVTCVNVQRVVEHVLAQPLSKHEFEDLCTVMMSDALQALCDGVGYAYTTLSGKSQLE